MSPWYAVFCRPRREALAEENLLRQGYRVFLPRLATQARKKGRWADVCEPLFPRYLFVAAADARQSLAPVRSTLGVSNLVRFGGQPAIVPDELVETLRQRHDPLSGACVITKVFTPGDKVILRSGPMSGIEGVFEIEAGADRVYVLLELLGSINRVKVARDWLVPAA